MAEYLDDLDYALQALDPQAFQGAQLVLHETTLSSTWSVDMFSMQHTRNGEPGAFA